jgi:hypothetical protein
MKKGVRDEYDDDPPGHCKEVQVERRNARRVDAQVLTIFATPPAWLLIIQPCASAPRWARKLAEPATNSSRCGAICKLIIGRERPALDSTSVYAWN